MVSHFYVLHCSVLQIWLSFLHMYLMTESLLWPSSKNSEFNPVYSLTVYVVTRGPYLNNGVSKEVRGKARNT